MRRLLAAAIVLLASALPARAADCDLTAADAASAGPHCARAWMDQNLRMNDIVTVGTHNSYKQAIPDRIMALVRMGSREAAAGLDYSHLPLTDQLNDGARAIELDVVYDPKGGLFAHPAGATLAGLPVSDDYAALMMKPGFKVMHVQDIDYRSVCTTFLECLRQLKSWSDTHRSHVPILLSLNAKDDAISMPGSVTPLKFDPAAFDALDAEILSVFSRDDLVTPARVRGIYRTLREAVLQGGWPTLGQSRGKFIFALDEGGDKIATYLTSDKAHEGRVMFVNALEDSPSAAYLTLNEALSDTARIVTDVQLGYLVRTRADADTVEARSNDTARRDKALASGAQYVSTDYMRPDPRFGTYQARLPEGVIAACNPQRHPERCAGLPVEPAP